MGLVLLCVLGKFDAINQTLHTAQFPKYLRGYRCLFETKELGCLLGSDICHIPPGSSCMTLLIKNSKLLSPVLGPFHSQMVTTCLLRCIPSLVPPTLSSCSLTVFLFPVLQGHSLSPLHLPPSSAHSRQAPALWHP